MVPVHRDRGGQSPAAAAVGCRSDRLSVLRKPLTRVRARQGTREEDDGLPLSDEVLLLIISRVAGDTADLVRCVATCRRWRRLVSTDAAFICLHAPPRTDQSARGLALGVFLLSHPEKIEFVPLPSASRRIGALGPPSLDLLVDDEGSMIFHASFRVVASRGGRLVVEIRSAEPVRAAQAVYSIYVGYGDLYGDAMFSGQRSAMDGRWCFQGVARLPELIPELSAATSVRLRWFCEQSGLVFFTARSGHGPDFEESCYTLNLGKPWRVDKVASNGAGGKPWLAVYGYEMDRVTFLSSLGEKR
ncbi:uncharacterized protein C2845_PM06G13200 [Panicum miliaceum]|uniref:F-box domain-containing protein n=1 Tax=Panicum miliaceum TaxID=4540 RepID=A0A3L6REU5_PANMI|nr:uncharacterized protein C2845_PM06G13200 [Panicum miliaceum]